MKSIYFSEEHEIFRKSVRQFIEKEVVPFANEWEEKRHIPKSIWKKMGDAGFLGISLPEAVGGLGADLFYAIAFLEELGRAQMGGFCAAVAVQEFIATSAIAHNGTKEQIAKYLVPSIRGEKVGAICISEPNAGSDVAAIQTSAVKDGDSWVINGAKTWVTNGVYADFYVVACKTDRAAGSGGISLILVDAGTKGLSATKLNKIGFHSSDTAELSFDNVRVPLNSLVGKEQMGFYYIMHTFVIERLSLAASTIGTASFAMEQTLSYMETRQAFGKPINQFQALRHRMADLIAETEAAKLSIYHATWLAANGKPAVREASIAKLLATETAKKVVDECLQFHGGFGYVEEYPIARAYRDTRVSTIVGGTTEIMREIICKADIDKVEFKPKRV